MCTVRSDAFGKRAAFLAALGFIGGGTLVRAEPPAPASMVGRIQVRGTINPASAGYIARAISEATASGAQCLIVELDTPGGLLDSTKEIVQSF
ncbi:MAG: hypothetical protein ABI565_00240, partial [Vicinamibacteria bacterium]